MDILTTEMIEEALGAVELDDDDEALEGVSGTSKHPELGERAP